MADTKEDNPRGSRKWRDQEEGRVMEERRSQERGGVERRRNQVGEE